MARLKQPVTIWGIEFDALISDSKSMTTTIPSYPVERGYQVSDTMFNSPLTIELVLYVSDTPVTWLNQHGQNRCVSICEMIENKWASRELTKIVTPDAIYTDMGITSIKIEHSKEIGYARQVSITAQKVVVTNRHTTLIPDYSLLSGTSEANATTSTAEANQKKSVLYGVASGLTTGS